MKKELSKKEAERKINEFFSSSDFSSQETKKIIRLANKHRIRLKENRRLFCKSCLSPLRGKVRISKTHKTVLCSSCRKTNKFRIS